MKKLNNKLDEMQELNLLHIEKTGYWFMFFGLTLSIVVQEMIYREEALEYIAGETTVFLISGVCFLFSAIRKGLWDRKVPATPFANLIQSILCSAIFSIILGIVKYLQYGSLQGAVASAVVFFIFIGIVCFIVLTILMLFYKRQKKKLEEREEND